jgi:hypothetical protein
VAVPFVSLGFLLKFGESFLQPQLNIVDTAGMVRVEAMFIAKCFLALALEQTFVHFEFS